MSNERDDIEKYLKGELTAAEMHALEKKALRDPFLRDALEGASSVSVADFSKDIKALQQRVHRQPKAVWFTPLRVAAGVVLVGAAALFAVLQYQKPANELAQVEKETATGAPKDEPTKNISDTLSTSGPVKSDQLLSLNQQNAKPQTEAKPSQTSRAAEAVETEPTDNQPSEGEALKTEERTEADEVKADRVIEELKEAPKVAEAELSKQDVTRSSALRKKTANESAAGAASFAATKTIRGSVKSTDGQPLPGVTILIKGTTEGAVSDINGRYAITTQQANPNLVFSFIGLHTSEVTPTDTSNVDMVMREDLSQLSEVVVTASGMARDDAQGPVIRLAEPYGGRKAYDKYLDDNLRYPAEALEKKVKGRVVIEFSVDTTGKIGEFNVIRSLGYGCDEEVIRLVKDGPKWLPTTEDDVAVESNVRVRMKFDPAKHKK